MDVYAGVKRRTQEAVAAPFKQWGIEIAMRYIPMVRVLKAAGHIDDVTEIGCGGLGITPYLRRRITGVDQEFGQWPSPLVETVRGSALDLPFEDASRPCVVSTDMLEHIPPELRAAAVDEMVRVTSDLLIVAVPAGRPAEDQDSDLDEFYLQVHGERYPFLSEHVENGLPTPEEFEGLVRSAVAKRGDRAQVSFQWNSNLQVRNVLMRIWIRGGWWRTLFLNVLNYAHPVFSRMNFGDCYRLIAVIRFGEASPV